MAHAACCRYCAVVALALVPLVAACKKNESAARADGAREVNKDTPLFFTYVDTNGLFATTDKADKVPEATRRLVRVMGRARGATWRNDTSVDVVDLRELLAQGKTWSRVMGREAFETAALAQLPPGDSCTLAGPHGPALPEEKNPVAPSDDPPIVVLYATNWCQACKDARQYLLINRIPFTHVDIERAPQAADDMRKKATRLGIQADRVPILDVRGRWMIGFDETRLDGMLADW